MGNRLQCEVCHNVDDLQLLKRNADNLTHMSDYATKRQKMMSLPQSFQENRETNRDKPLQTDELSNTEYTVNTPFDTNYTLSRKTGLTRDSFTL